MERKLLAVLAADIQGFSRLMGADEKATMEALHALSSTVIGPACHGNQGKVVKTLGDGWIITFASSVAAVNCAIQIQDRLIEHDRFVLRIGVHAGDVICDDDDVFGDTVNIAVRLEGVCIPGEVTISDAAMISLDGTLTPSFDDGGERELKNIARPIRAWTRVRPLLQPFKAMGDNPQLSIVPVSCSNSTEETLEVADALSSDLENYLGTLQWMQASLQPETSNPGSYVLQTRLRVQSDKLRLDARLDGRDGDRVWTKKYDGAAPDIFDWQDRTGEEIASEVIGVILDLEFARLEKIPEHQLTAQQVFLLGLMKFRSTEESVFFETLEHLTRAIEMDPEFSEAYGETIMLALSAGTIGFSSIEQFTSKLPDLANQARKLEALSPLTELSIAVFDYFETRAVRDFREKVGQILRRAPSNVRLLGYAGWSYVWLGDPQLALDCFEKYRRLGRFDPLLGATEGGIAVAHVLAENYSSAIRIAERGLTVAPDYPTLHMVLAASHARLGNFELAGRFIEKVSHLVPDISVAQRRKTTFYGGSEAGERYFQALELAGMPSV